MTRCVAHTASVMAHSISRVVGMVKYDGVNVQVCILCMAFAIEMLELH
jgi:hypothetical protein